MLAALSKVRQPVVAPLTETTKVDGIEMPINMEAFLIALGKKLELPGFGKDALGPGKNFDHQDDWYLKNVANIAMGDKKGDSVPAADSKEMDIFRKARTHLPKSVFDEERWKNAAGADYWPHASLRAQPRRPFRRLGQNVQGRQAGSPLLGYFSTIH